jgi:polar amino acid transport system permease protein
VAYALNFAPVLARSPDLVIGVRDTVTLSVEAIALGLAVGLAVAVIRVNGWRWLRMICAVYVEIFRNTPMLVQLFLFFFGLPYIGLRLQATPVAVIAVALNLGAYAGEIFRAGLLAVPKTQIEAGLALGLSGVQVFRYVVLVPALRVIYPALTGQLTLTLLGTSLVSSISANELTHAGTTIESQTFLSLETFIVLVPIYIAITFAFRLVYWLFGLWLFRRRVPTGDAAASLRLPASAEVVPE